MSLEEESCCLHNSFLTFHQRNSKQQINLSINLAGSFPEETDFIQAIRI